jgi:hypothetical protein
MTADNIAPKQNPNGNTSDSILTEKRLLNKMCRVWLVCILKHTYQAVELPEQKAIKS